MNTPEALIAQLERHLAEVRRAADDNEFVDVAQAEHLHLQLRRAVTGWADLDDGQRAILSEAVRYFVQTDDEENDLHSPIGFDDDAEMVEAALRRLTPPGAAGTGSASPTT
ncbi:hypothetical protein [Pseudonocardia sp. H11422]|uniref:hypothetical protein n=1 Tax=Pseudonocardia sp. H11422 TaxID=2835866 RepID=UPI001BDCDF26|nr:hypothetical protein [Pseudonocardia sp. H11422]